MAQDNKVLNRQKIHWRIRKRIQGTATKPRLSVFRSNNDIYAQLINDENGTTIVAANSKMKDVVAHQIPKVEKSKIVGQMIAQKAKVLGIQTCVFDRSGYLYHGRIKAVADGAREGGLIF